MASSSGKGSGPVDRPLCRKQAKEKKKSKDQQDLSSPFCKSPLLSPFSLERTIGSEERRRPEEKLVSFLRWNGNKSHYLRRILPLFPSTHEGKYIEPFLGSGAVFLALAPSRYLVGDINYPLMQLWRLLRNRPSYLVSALKRFRNEFITEGLQGGRRAQLLYCREWCRRLDHRVVVAGSDKEEREIWTPFWVCRWWLLSLSAFMGTLVHHGRFYFNGLDLNILKHDRHTAFTDKFVRNLWSIHRFLRSREEEKRNETIQWTDYRRLLRQAKEGDFVFMDPPYVRTPNHDNNICYHPGGEEPSIVDLHKECKKLDERRVKWMMVQVQCPTVAALFKDYRIVPLSRYEHRTQRTVVDVLIMNYKKEEHDGTIREHHAPKKKRE